MKKKLCLLLFSFLILFFQNISLAAKEKKIISGKASKVVITDGDSLKINNIKIRLIGIDAPEIKQICNHNRRTPSGVVKKIPYACGEVSKSYLTEILNSSDDPNQKVFCYYSEIDRYKRVLGECYIDEESALNINFEMVMQGHAVAYLQYSKKYLNAQEFAKKHELGVWRGDFEMPWDWRRKNK